MSERVAGDAGLWSELTRITVGSGRLATTYVQRPREVVLQLAPAMPDSEFDQISIDLARELGWERVPEVDNQLTQRQGDVRTGFARHLRDARMVWLRIPESDEISDAPIAIVDLGFKLREQHPGVILSAAPVYLGEARIPENDEDAARALMSAAIPVHNRLIVHPKTANGEQSVRQRARELDLDVVNILDRLISNSPVRKSSVALQHRIATLRGGINDGEPFPLVLIPMTEDTNALRLIQTLESSLGDVASVELDWRRLNTWQAYSTPAEWSPATFWNLDNVNALKAWQITRGRRSTVVALLDSGFDITHHELKLAYVKNSALHFDTEAASDLKSNYHNVSAVSDDHGTLVAGVVAASHKEQDGALGFAPMCSIMPIKLGAIPSALEIGEGLLWACVNGALVANMSLETPPIDTDDYFISLVWKAGMVMVAATGNDGGVHGPRGIAFPARHSDVIAVGASDEYGLRIAKSANSTWGSQFGDEIDVVAPGYRCTSTVPKHLGYGVVPDFEGTSAASPHVAALAGLLFSRDESLLASEVREAILRSCDFPASLRATASKRGDGYAADWHEDVGFGCINGRAALDRVDH